MAKQLLFYDQVVPVSKEKHGNLSVKTGDNYQFAKQANAIPITLGEFAPATQEYPLVFVENQNSLMPVVVVGLQAEQNLYVADNGEWQGKYIPAFVRRYPFVFALSDDEKTFTLCVDESFSGCNENGRGERLFDTEGEETQYLKNVLNFLKNYQTQFQATEQFSQKLKDLELLEQMQMRFDSGEDQPSSLSGFFAVNREKVQQLSGEQLAELMQLGWLELIYLHLHSINNFSNVVERSKEAKTNSGTETSTEQELATAQS